MVAANEAIRREQRARADDTRITRRDVERPNVLVLRLVDLVVRVRNVKSRSRRLNIQVAVISAIESLAWTPRPSQRPLPH